MDRQILASAEIKTASSKYPYIKRIRLILKY